MFSLPCGVLFHKRSLILGKRTPQGNENIDVRVFKKSCSFQCSKKKEFAKMFTGEKASETSECWSGRILGRAAESSATKLTHTAAFIAAAISFFPAFQPPSKI